MNRPPHLALLRVKLKHLHIIAARHVTGDDVLALTALTSDINRLVQAMGAVIEPMTEPLPEPAPACECDICQRNNE